MKATVRHPGLGETVQLRIEGIAPGDDAGKEPTPEELLAASLASCTATTMELYARRKGWEVGEIGVDVDYTPAQRGSPTRCTVVVRLPEDLASERRDRLMQLGATSSVHRTLEGEILFEERLELATPGPKAESRHGGSQPLPRRIALLNRLRRIPQGPPA